MGLDPDHLGRSGGMLSDFGRLLERAAHAAGPASSMAGRLAAALSVVQLGGRLIPSGGRLVRRHPVGSMLVLAGVLGTVYLSRAPRRRRSFRLRSG